MRPLTLVPLACVFFPTLACVVVTGSDSGSGVQDVSAPHDAAFQADAVVRSDAAVLPDVPPHDASSPTDLWLPELPPMPDTAPPVDAGYSADAGQICYGDHRCASTEVCERTSCDAPGTCEIKPSGWVCDMWGSYPVCDCEGRTWYNDCQRRRGGASKAYEGECIVPDSGMPDVERTDAIIWTTCISTGVCGEGKTCDLAGCAAEGYVTCIPTPGDCGSEEAPVCGCNGVTYGNDCLRVKSGFALDHAGACEGEAFGNCSATEPCPEGQVCDLRSCAADASGICMLQPISCNGMQSTLCTCIGRTYPNDCERLRPGMIELALDHEGACN